MKELSIIKQMVADGQISQEIAEKYFPQLKGSENEKIREQIVYAINQLHVCECTKNKLLTWFEKQCKHNSINNQFTPKQESILNKHIDKFLEQKHTWGEEDESWFKEIELMCLNFSNNTDYREKFSTWFKSLKDRVQPQPKQEWREEDDKIKKTLIHIVKGACDKYGIKYQGKEISGEKLLDWIEKQGK